MTRPLYIALLLSLVSRSSAQDQFVFIIDTVITPSDGFPVRSLQPGHSLSFDTTDRITTYYEEWNESPNVLLHIPRKSFDGGLRLALDEDEGELMILWPATFDQDTIRIPRYEVFRRCIRDTISTHIEYFSISDTSSAPIGIKHKRYPGPKPKCRKKRKQIALRINGVAYEIPITIERSSELPSAVFHGYIPYGCNEERRPINRCKYFRGIEQWTKWGYFGEVILR